MPPGPHEELSCQNGDQDDGVKEEPNHGQDNQERNDDLVRTITNDVIFTKIFCVI